MITQLLLLFLVNHNILTRAEKWVVTDKVGFEVHEIITFNYDKSNDNTEDNDEFNDNYNDDDKAQDNQLDKPLMIESSQRPTSPFTKSTWDGFVAVVYSPTLYAILVSIGGGICGCSCLIGVHSHLKKQKRQSDIENAATWRIVTQAQTEAEYNYDQFKSEYDEDIEVLKEEQAKLNETEFRIKSKSQCKADRFYNKGPFTAMCLIKEYINGPTQEIKEEAGAALGPIFALWGILLLLFVIIGWGHYGYCNEFCPLDVCHPDDGYEEIKQYLVLNPPGTMLKKVIPKKDDMSRTMTKNVYYNATEMEHYLYNNLWNKLYHA